MCEVEPLHICFFSFPFYMLSLMIEGYLGWCKIGFKDKADALKVKKLLVVETEENREDMESEE